MTLDPQGTLLNIAGLAFLCGMGWALISALVIYAGSRWIPPSIPRGRVWAEWRRRRMVWALGLAVGVGGSWIAADQIGRGLALKDLYWVTRAGEILTIARLGALSGYLFLLLVFVTSALLARRARVKKLK